MMWRKLAECDDKKEEFRKGVVEETIIDNSKIIRIKMQLKVGGEIEYEDIYIILINSDENTFNSSRYANVYKYTRQPEDEWHWSQWEKFKHDCPGFIIVGPTNDQEKSRELMLWFLGDIKDFAHNPQKYPNLWNLIKILFSQYKENSSIGIGTKYMPNNLEYHYYLMETDLQSYRREKWPYWTSIWTAQLYEQGVHKNIIVLIVEAIESYSTLSGKIIYPKEPIKHPLLGEFYLEISIGVDINSYGLSIIGIDAKFVEDLKTFDKILDELHEHYKKVNNNDIILKRFIRYHAKDWREALKEATKEYQERCVTYAAKVGAKLDPEPFKENGFIHIRPAYRTDFYHVKKAKRVDMSTKTFFEEFIPAYIDLLANEVKDPNLLPCIGLERKRVLIATRPSNDSYFNKELQNDEGIKKISQLAKSIQEKSPYKKPSKLRKLVKIFGKIFG